MQLQVFQHKDLGNVRVIGSHENPLFCLRDICEVLEHTNPSRLLESINAEFGGGLTLSYPIIDTLGREQQATFITEPQLYFVLMRSDKPKAKPFRQWVTSEVLPSIRKNGYYINQNKNDRAKQEHILQSLITELQDSNTLKDSVKQENENLKNEIIALQRKLLSVYETKDKMKEATKAVPEHFGERLSESEKAQILSLRKEGKSMREIQRIMQRSEHALYCAIREAKRGVL